MKKTISILITLALVTSMTTFPTVSAQASGSLALSVTASEERVTVGDEIVFTISMGNAVGFNLSAFSFRIQLSNGLELKVGSAYLKPNFRVATGMYMATFDEKPYFMVSGFGGAGYNGGSLDIATFTCVVTAAETIKVDLYDVLFYNVENKPITVTVNPAIISYVQGDSSGSGADGSQNGGADSENANNASGTNGTNASQNDIADADENNAIGNDRNDEQRNDSNTSRSEDYGFSEMVLQPSEWANPFSDVAHNDWFYEYVAMVHTNGLFTGTSATTFSPDVSVTRAMFARILANLEKVDLNSYTASRFTDVPPEQWYTSAIEWAANMGIVNGYGNNLFGPNDEITREQMAVMLNNYIIFKGITLPTNRTPSAFADEDEFSSWAVDSVKVIQAAGIISGRPGNLYAPKATATRAEVATIFARFIETVVQQ